MLFAAYDKGSRDALARLGVKRASIPTARVVMPGSGVRTPAMPAAPAGAQALPSLPSRAMEAVHNIPGRISGMMRPVRRAVGLAGLGAAGALAYGMHHQNTEDHENQNLVYTPLPGSVMG